MAESDKVAPGKYPDLPPPPADKELAQLRSLLLEREIALLDRLGKRLDSPTDHARDISAVIAEALLLRADKDDKLRMALEPPVEKIFKDMLRKKPQDAAAALFPIIGATIRRSIAESFRSMLGDFNKSLAYSFSLKGLRWRFEAMRSGKPFSEIVLLHTLLYRVEQVFFIHAETGLVLAHAEAEGIDAQDADMVSAMLTAIQDFVRDCFARGHEGQLESLRLGDFTIYIERSPQAYLACVLRGTPPADFRALMSTILEVLLLEYADALAGFNGDNSLFQGARRHLRDCLISKTEHADRPVPFWLKIAPLCIVLGLAGAFGWRLYEKRLEEQELSQQQAARQERLAAYRQIMEQGVAAIRREPGYVVLEVKRAEEGRWELFCMKDTMARPYEDVLRAHGYSSAAYSIRTIPYLSYQPDLVRARVAQKIKPPDTVSVHLDDNGILRLSGTAHMGWILQARQTALSLTGITDVDISNLKDERNERLLELVRSVEGVSILFPLGKDVPAPSEMAKLTAVSDTLVELERLADSMNMLVSLTIYGHADAVGNDKRNYEISQARARTLAALLYARGSAIPITLYGMGAEHADKTKGRGGGDQGSRRIELRVRLTLAPEAELEMLQGGGRN